MRENNSLLPKHPILQLESYVIGFCLLNDETDITTLLTSIIKKRINKVLFPDFSVHLH